MSLAAAWSDRPLGVKLPALVAAGAVSLGVFAVIAVSEITGTGGPEAGALGLDVSGSVGRFRYGIAARRAPGRGPGPAALVRARGWGHRREA